ncbi:uncharacterized protein LOC122278700 [Carya illinoinensis]|uniref:uncharacterized protein LOC122278700 n=1 Tax=Carya illinoinensis TaxID=32201 RepID=UPI001C71A61B|nr:uncharacterized protein LOC122278700 [Carya illinoinensis]
MKESSAKKARRGFSFKFEASWLKEEGFGDVLKQYWDESQKHNDPVGDIEKAFESHYSGVYKTVEPRREEIDSCLGAMGRRVSDSMNEKLQKEFTKAEVEMALKMIGPLKSPGLDGFGANFFQQSWSIIGDDMSEAALKVLNGDGGLIGLNGGKFVVSLRGMKGPQGLGARVQSDCKKYLGLPAMVGMSKYNTFRGIKDRVWEKVYNWKNKFLSPAGKEIVLKVVVQAIPNYHMNVFKLPKRLCNEMFALMARFWWGFKKNYKNIQWCSWSKMGRSKNEGGLGFREFDSFNNALLAKQCWRVLKFPQSMASVVLKEKYFRYVDMLKANIGQRRSLIWRSLWGSLNLLRKGLLWRVGNGHNIRIWGDKWVPRLFSYSIQSPVKGLHADAKMRELMVEEGGEWNEEVVRNTLNEENANLEIKGDVSERKDEEWKVLWQLKVPRVVKMFLWKALIDSLPTRKNLVKRRIVVKSCYPICESEEESIGHAIWNCVSASDVWNEIESPVQKWGCTEWDLFVVWAKMVENLSQEQLEFVATVMRKIWLRRNQFVFENVFIDPKILFKQVVDSLVEFQLA